MISGGTAEAASLPAKKKKSFARKKVCALDSFTSTLQIMSSKVNLCNFLETYIKLQLMQAKSFFLTELTLAHWMSFYLPCVFESHLAAATNRASIGSLILRPTDNALDCNLDKTDVHKLRLSRRLGFEPACISAWLLANVAHVLEKVVFEAEHSAGR